MSCSNCVPEIQKNGTKPVNMQWSVVRGDTATIRIEFWESDETTEYDTTGWLYEATAYNPSTDTSYVLQTSPTANYVDVTALPEDTVEWGTGVSSVVAELSFDLEVTIPGESSNIVWTPVVGTICVLGDVTGGSL